MNIQGMVNAMNDRASQERARYHLTLGGLIKKLKPHKGKGKGLTVALGDPGSYRGYYVDLAFASTETPLDDLLARAERCVGETFEGYKGGDFRMSESTPLWVASYGDCGEALMDVLFEEGEDSAEVVTMDIGIGD